MEERLVEMEEIMKRLTTEVDSLRKENEALKSRNGPSGEDATRNQVDRVDMEANSAGVGKGHQEDEETKRLHHDVCSLMDKYEEMAKKIGTSSSVHQLLSNTNLSFSAEIMAMPLPPKFKISLVDLYDGSKDPVEYLETFKTHMTFHRSQGEVACDAFALTLKGSTRGWFGTLQPGSIQSFDKLGQQFLTQFMASRRHRRPATYILTIKQRRDESLKAYLANFNKEKMAADDQDEKIMLVALLGGVWPSSPFMAELARKIPSTPREFMDKANNFVNAEDTLIALTTRDEGANGNQEELRGRTEKGVRRQEESNRSRGMLAI
ncbi:uncharacterized protein LOC121242392 [Juglans microcarpa x Juglans regia]|uniref:uncharacterized protein LOC121242392 n=1 Tax=Juglans microcarpa x Juglans regia TaxID=2249226 RepID=UPI001B7F235B|nr:uncharacterized protein LOC121242392 [Juglans microcarpa x Juglans regia]